MNRDDDDETNPTDDEDKIDFGPLDPARDRARWAALVDGIVARAAQARRPSIPRQVLVWARPTLAVAASLALAVWAAAYLGGREPEAEAAPTELLTRWAQTDEVPAAAQILEVLGDADGSN